MSSIDSLNTEKSGQVAFLANRKYINQLKTTKASIVVLTNQKELSLSPINTMVVDNVYLDFTKIANLFLSNHNKKDYFIGIHETSIIS